MGAHAIEVTISIDTKQTSPISRLIYGINAYVYDSEWQALEWKVGLDNHEPGLNITSRRLGGNTMTSYNWENGFSNSGADDNHSSNNFQSFITGAGSPPYDPGAALTTFHNHSLNLGAYTLLQLPAAGYVAADEDGSVALDEAAPSPRWKEVVFDKPGSPKSLLQIPDLEDDKVYVDEEINFLIDVYGSASTPTGIKAYEIDNEPGLWHHFPKGAGTHPRLHSEFATCDEVLERNIALARVVRRIDPAAKIYGPAMWGYGEFYSFWSVFDGTLHQPSDWGIYNREPYLTKNTGDSYRYNRMTWVNAYLDRMRVASKESKTRLLDVLSVHYYPDDEAVSSEQKRVQAPRSLWDPKFIETSWITKEGNGFTDGRSLELIPKLQRAIDDFYPETKLAITEYSFGGRHDISGGIAQADVLGIFGQHGVYAANYFFTVDDYIAAAFRIYRNYDGMNSTFGDTAVACTTTDYENSSVYASLDDEGRLHVIAINKSFDRELSASIEIQSAKHCNSATSYGFGPDGSEIVELGSTKVDNNGLNYTFPPLTVRHIVLL